MLDWETTPPSYLNSHFGQVDLHRQFLSAVHVRIVGFLKSSLQFMQLVGGEGRTVPPVLFLGLVFIRKFPVTVVAGGQFWAQAIL